MVVRDEDPDDTARRRDVDTGGLVLRGAGPRRTMLRR